MKMAEELQRELRSINRKSYPAYKGLKGGISVPGLPAFYRACAG